MAVERWFAIARPMKYKIKFKRNKVVAYAVILAVLSIVLTVHLSLENHLREENGRNSCFYKSLITPKAAENAVNIVYCFITVFLPLIFVSATNVSIWKIVKNQVTSEPTNTRRHLEMRLLRMSILVALFITICFVPNQISYILAMTLDSHPYTSPVHFATVVLSMFNSCVNPFIYCLTNNLYRKEIISLFYPCKKNDDQNQVSRIQLPTTSGIIKSNVGTLNSIVS